MIRRKEPATVAAEVALPEKNIVPSMKDPQVLERKQKQSISTTHIKISVSKIRGRQ